LRGARDRWCKHPCVQEWKREEITYLRVRDFRADRRGKAEDSRQGRAARPSGSTSRAFGAAEMTGLHSNQRVEVDAFHPQSCIALAVGQAVPSRTKVGTDSERPFTARAPSARVR
jgi:hypothetical protein